MSASTSTRSCRVRRICETFHRPFDSQEVYIAQDELTKDEIEQELREASCDDGFLSEFQATTHNKRALYVYREDRRSYGPVTFAMARRVCADCGKTVEPGDTVYNPRRKLNGNDRSKWLCRDCGFKALAREYDRLISMR